MVMEKMAYVKEEQGKKIRKDTAFNFTPHQRLIISFVWITNKLCYMNVVVG